MNKPRRPYWAQKLLEFRHSLSFFDALPQLTVLGFIVGIISGLIIVVFRFVIDHVLVLFVSDQGENFEALPWELRLLTLSFATTLLIALLGWAAPNRREMSVSHVIDRIHNHQSKLPFRNWLYQLVGAFVALIGGHSVGREGPVAHLGAGTASFFGQWLKLPNNSLQTLVGCGVAAAISASFNTPMAGVIFAMEVLAIEYTILGFVPVIMASVMGAVVSQAVLGDAGFITVGDTDFSTLLEVPLMALIGAVIALCAGIYIRLNIATQKFIRFHLAWKLVLACVLTALVSIGLPQVMGQGYDTLNSAIAGDVALSLLIAIGLAKLLLTPVVVGLGVPGGLIGPMLVIGGCIGGAFGVAMAELFPSLGVHPSFYVLMGMAGMTAGALNAPLTALVTVLELSVNPNIIFPSMLVVVVACVGTRQIFGVKGIFIEQLRHSKRTLELGPAQQALRRAGVRSVMSTRFVITPADIDHERAAALLANHPKWIVILDKDKRYESVMRAADLANFLEAEKEDAETPDATEILSLNEVPGRRFRLSAIHESATLYEAMRALKAAGTEALYVSGPKSAYAGDLKGILMSSSIENYYQPVEFRHAVD